MIYLIGLFHYMLISTYSYLLTTQIDVILGVVSSQCVAFELQANEKSQQLSCPSLQRHSSGSSFWTDSVGRRCDSSLCPLQTMAPKTGSSFVAVQRRPRWTRRSIIISWLMDSWFIWFFWTFYAENSSTEVPRPSELFYNKLTPLLEAQGLSADPRHRSQWPLEILRQVLLELSQETPNDLVAR